MTSITSAFSWLSAEVLTCLFTGITAYIAWKVMKAQETASLPTMFLKIERYDNGVLLRFSFRNRHNHPIKILRVKSSGCSPSVKLSLVTSKMIGTIGTKPVRQISTNGIADYSIPINMELGSAERGSDSGEREFQLLSTLLPSQTLYFSALVDMCDGTEKYFIIKRKITLSEELRKIIKSA